MRVALQKMSLVAGFLLVSGCSLAPNRVQYPTVWFQSERTQRKAAQIQDPYPDASVGPSVGFRPLGFQTQRSVPQQTKDRFYSGFLKRNMTGMPAPGQPPISGVPPMQGAGVPPMQGAGVQITGPVASQPIYSPPMYLY